MMGYLNAEEDNLTDDGWYMTGDIVEVDSKGYLRILGRQKEVINVGGQKVLPTEVEEVLMQMPEVTDCIVYGEKNLITGQIVVADIVLNRRIDDMLLKRKIWRFCSDKIDKL